MKFNKPQLIAACHRYGYPVAYTLVGLGMLANLFNFSWWLVYGYPPLFVWLGY